MLNQISESVWTLEKDFQLMGGEIGNRCTIVKLSSGNLWVHSPVKVDEQDVQDICALGDVRFVVAPNNFHHVHLRHFKKYFPNAEYQGTQSLQKKRKGFSFDSLLESKSLYQWSNDLEHVFLFGMPMVQEVAFFHRKDKILIICDLFFNVQKTNFVGSLFTRLFGTYKTTAASRLFKSFIWNKREFKDSLNDIMSLDFNTIVLSHGDIIRSEAKACMKRVYPEFLGAELTTSHS